MRGDLQTRISPANAGAAAEFNTKTVSAAAEEANPNKINFLEVMKDSTRQKKEERAALKQNDLSSAKDYDQFLEMLSESTKQRREPKNVLNKDDFLKLFVTQLQHQDPLNPDDGAEMASKLAQFHSLEQMMNVNKTLEGMSKLQSDTRSFGMADYIGKDVTLEGGRARLEKGDLTDSEFTIPINAARARLEIRDGSGVLVHASELGSVAEGVHKIKWDAKLKDGQTAADGIYSFTVVATGENNENIPIEITSNAKITGVDLKNDGSLYTSLGKVDLSKVKSVGEKDFGKIKEAPSVGKERVENKLPVNLGAGVNPQMMTPEIEKELMRIVNENNTAEKRKSPDKSPEVIASADLAKQPSAPIVADKNTVKMAPQPAVPNAPATKTVPAIEHHRDTNT